MKRVSAALFKTHCLEYMDLARDHHETVVITKRGKPIAKLIPYETDMPLLFNRMRGTATIIGDIIEPIDVEWEANE